MGFYEDFALVYDLIFPPDNETIDFLSDFFQPLPADIVDLACGTGGYTLGLVRRGFRVVGIDLTSAMIRMAQQKSTAIPNARFQVEDMTTPGLKDGVYDGWFCIGNSLVHLNSPEAILTALSNWKKLLGAGGRWVIQILNYDRILKNSVTQLPTIYGAENTRLTRAYQLISVNARPHRINFRTELYYGNQVYHNCVPLYPLCQAEFLELADRAGLRVTRVLGDFSSEPWSVDSFALVLAGEIK